MKIHIETEIRRPSTLVLRQYHFAAKNAAFSLLELLATMAIISVLTGLTVPAIKGLTGSNNLNVGARRLAGLMNVARSEAISRNTVIRFAVARDWAGKPDANLRKVSLWEWDSELERFMQLGAWEELPIGVLLDPERPDYLKDASYAVADRSSVRGDSILTKEFDKEAEFNAGTRAEPIVARFVEFMPAGNVRIPGGTARQAIFVATQGFLDEGGTLTYTDPTDGRPGNWAQLNLDTLTGRVRVYQP